MERLMKAQALGDTSSLEFMRGRRILEINPDHPIIKDLNVSVSSPLLNLLLLRSSLTEFFFLHIFVQAACKNAPESSEATRVVDLLFDTAIISSGFTVSNLTKFFGFLVFLVVF